MNSVLSKLFAVSAVALMTQTAFAAERIMQGNSLVGGKGVSVGGQLYNVDLWPVGYSYAYPGPASPFSTQVEAEAALTAIYEQLIGDGHGAGPGSLVATRNYFGSPEQKWFGIAQTFGELSAPGQAMGVTGVFTTRLLITGQEGAPWPSAATLQLAPPSLYQLPSGPPGDSVLFPVWTPVASAVPEPAAMLLLVTGLAVVAWRAGARVR